VRKRLPLLAVVGVVVAIGAIAPAQARKPKPARPHPAKCGPHNSGYNASGVLIHAALTPSAKGRYTGTLEVNVTKANHHGATGDQTFTLTNARVKFHHGVDPAAPAAGSRVKLHGKITQLPKKCPTAGFTPTVTVKKVDISKAKK